MDNVQLSQTTLFDAYANKLRTRVIEYRNETTVEQQFDGIWIAVYKSIKDLVVNDGKMSFTAIHTNLNADGELVITCEDITWKTRKMISLK